MMTTSTHYYAPPQTDPQQGLSQSAMNEMETSLTRWIADPMATGDKEKAAGRIREAAQYGSPSLDLSYLNLNTLPDISLLTTLQTLDLRHNQFSRITIPELPQLESLDLSHNPQLTTIHFPNELPNMKALDINDTNLTDISLQNMPHLTILHLANNKLTSIDLPHLQCLTYIDLSNNQLTNITCPTNSLPNLRDLNVSGNSGLTELPIRLENNHLPLVIDTKKTAIPLLRVQEIFAQRRNELSALQAIELDLKAWANSSQITGNKGEAVQRISKAAREGLTSLDLSGLNLNMLPNSINELKTLRELNVSRNDLTKITFSTLPPALDTLNVCMNRRLIAPPMGLENNPRVRINIKGTQISPPSSWTREKPDNARTGTN